MDLFWIALDPITADHYAALRGTFRIEQAGPFELQTLGASWFVVWLDGERLTEGPARFPPSRPEYCTLPLQLEAGEHVLAIQAHHDGVTTRMLQAMDPFVFCRLVQGGAAVAIAWRGIMLPGYSPQVRRINPQLSWIEWCDTRLNPAGWRQRTFDDTAWPAAVLVEPDLPTFKPAQLGEVQSFVHTLRPIAEGPLAATYGYERDDIATRFFLRDLECKALPPGGVWRRYDLGRVRLGRPRFVLDLPAGAEVEFAYCESLQHGRVAPYITLSLSESCNLDHAIARGGEQTFCPLTPRGGRFIELHVLSDRPEAIRIVREDYLERGYFGEAEGQFASEDVRLNTIWAVGVETLRACAEDALMDNPTRERGQWTGDGVSIGLLNSAAAYGDLRLIRRALIHAADCAREDGLVAGLSPGGPAYFASYAAMWAEAGVEYFEHTGDLELLRLLFPAAERNMAAFEAHLRAEGVSDTLCESFIDWGYVRNAGPIGLAANLHYLAALRAMARWSEFVMEEGRAAHYTALAGRIEASLRGALERGGDGAEPEHWRGLGYQTTVHALRLGLIPTQHLPAAIEAIKAHILGCFPNDAEAPRLASPATADPRLLTPFFSHYAMGVLIEHGELPFVLDQYRVCWGWALDQGWTTWPEVFDPRWTHCHHWSGCPTWQLSRYVLGLRPRFDLGADTYALTLKANPLRDVQGVFPMPAEGRIEVEHAAGTWQITPSRPITLLIPQEGAWEPIRVETSYSRAC